MAKIYKPTESNIIKASEIIKSGGVVAFPTETVYGLGADVFNRKAVAKIYNIKNRPRFNPLIVHIADIKDLRKLVKSIDKRVKNLTAKFWPGPLTVLLPKSDIVPDIVTAGLNNVAIRMPMHKAALKLIKESGRPIAAPSANPFGYISPTKAEHVQSQIGPKIDFIIDGGQCSVGIESTVVEISDKIKILRLGGLTLEELKKYTDNIEIARPCKRPNSPGQLKSHYSPLTPLKIIKGKIKLDKNEKAGLLAFKNNSYDINFNQIQILSETGDLVEAGANFFSYLHKLDNAGLDVIYAEKVPEAGVGMAINDRLIKAANAHQ